MPRKIYKPKSNKTIKVRLQHTDPSGGVSELLQLLAVEIDKSRLCSFSAPRLGTNPKYAGNQATAMYLELDFQMVELMFQSVMLIKDELFEKEAV